MRLPEPGDIVLDKYRVDEVIGEGGFGLVVRATTMLTGRLVAIKALKPPSDGDYGEASTKRFLREMRAIGNLTSEATLTMYDFSRTPDGLLIMVCEYVPGEDLFDLLKRRGGLQEREVVHILTQILHSLSEAHSLGLLHRDIKPQNVRIFERDGDPLRVKVLDFGLAFPLDSDAPRITSTGRAVGTPRYMSPEQLTGETLTPASDLFSLGFLACEMLLGRDAALLKGHMAQSRNIQLSVADPVSEHLRSIVNKMLAFDVGERFGSADEVLAALHADSTAVSSQSFDPTEDRVPTRKPRGGAVSGAANHAQIREVQPSGARRSVAVILLIAAIVVAAGLTLVLATRPDAPEPTPAVARTSMLLAPPNREPDRPERPVPVSSPDPGGVDRSSTPGCGQSPPFEGTDTLKLLDGLTEHRWTVHVPSAYDPNVAHPVVVVFHQDAMSGASFLQITGFGRLADRERFVVIAPDAGTWFSAGTETKAVSALAGVAQKLCLDPTRIYLVGHQTGAYAVERLACAAWVAGIATNAGRLDNSRCPNETRPVPHVAIAPTRSRYLPLKGGLSCTGRQTVSLDDYEKLWTERNECSGKRRAEREATGVSCATWDCAAPFVSCEVDGALNWPGSGRRELDLTQCDAHEPLVSWDATTKIWAFLAPLRNDRGVEGPM